MVRAGNKAKRLSSVNHTTKTIHHHHRRHNHHSSFKLLCNQEPVLPIDVKYNLLSTENSNRDGHFDKDIFEAVLVSSNVIREEVHRKAGENMKGAERKQQRDYESRNKSSASNDVYIGAEVLLRNNKWNN